MSRSRGAAEPSPDAVVMGGGVIGLAVAWRSAAAGLRVTLVDDRPGTGASAAAAGMLAPVTEVHYGEEALLRLNLASAHRYPSFVAELEEAAGQEVGYRATGTLAVARDRDDLAVLEELFAFQRRLGLSVQRLRAGECRALEPALAPGVRGGILVDGDHHVDNRALAAALLEACRHAGVTVVPARVREVVRPTGADKVLGVLLDDGSRIDAGSVVLAGGWESALIPGVPPGALPVRPVKGQLLYLGDPSGTSLLQRNVRGLEVYLAPRGDGRIVVGATMEERGLDGRVTAGAVHDLLRATAELLPGFDELTLLETVVGFRPGTPDNAPLLGPFGPEGLVAATGHYRHGILLAPITADLVAEFLRSGAMPELGGAFTPARFAAEPSAVVS